MGAVLNWTAEAIDKQNGGLVAAAYGASPEALAILEEGRVLYVNSAYTQLLGTVQPDGLEECCRCLRRQANSSDPAPSPVKAEDPGRASNGTPLCSLVITRVDGARVELEATCSPLRWNERQLLVVSFRDVSLRERRRAIRDSEKRYQAIFHASAMGILQCSLDGCVLESNPAIETLLGFSKDELHGKKLSELTHPQDVVGEVELFDELADGRRDSYQVEVRYLGKAQHAGWVRRSVSLVRSTAGEPQLAIAMMEDITERKRTEQQLRDAQKMEAVGRLVGGVAHDFNNLLTGIMLYCDLLLASLERSSKLGHHAEEIRFAAEQGAALIQQLLAIARQQVVEPRLLSVNDTVAKAHNLLGRLIGESIDFQTVLDDKLGEVRIDPAQVQQILFNLVLNARDAMPHGGRILVETANTEFIPSGGALPAATRVPGIRLKVTDTGCGMTPETLAHLFEPFFTTKKAGRGNGLGLATVHDIVQSNGGTIEVQSEFGHGTTVQIFLPRAPEQPLQVFPAAYSTSASGGTILLLEDNVIVRQAAEKVLADAGYRVLEAATGEEALAIAERFPGAVDLLIADIDLPGMSGCEVARKLGQTNSGLKSLYMSGYMTPTEDERVPDESVVFFQKPFTGALLLQRVQEILDAKPARGTSGGSER